MRDRNAAHYAQSVERRSMIAGAVICVATLALLATAVPARAQDPLELDTEPVSPLEEEWGLAITPYAWLAAQSTDVGGQEIRQSFNDLASLTNFGFQARLLARWRWVNFTADWTYADMQSEQRTGLTSIDLGVNQHILDMKLGGKVYDTRTPAQDGGLAIWVGAGARYWDNDVDYTITIDPILPGNDPTVTTGKTRETWWDPVLGLHMHFPVTPAVGFNIRATGGGLGIGDASDYMWDAEFAALFRLSRRLMLSAGYRQFKYKRTDGSGDDEIVQSVTVVGPSIGLSIGIF